MTYDTINDAVTMAGGEGSLLAGRYRIVRQLGQGGMGSVWLAEDTQLDDKPFAIKMLPPILVANKRAYRQLKDEALVAMKLTHPNIVTLRAFEENNGNPFLVMDYIDGQPLDDCLEEWGKLSSGQTVTILKPVAAALDYAHRLGVVHRDVKPGNVMVRKDGVPFVLDFGIAREIQETLTRVTGKLSSGTLLYMSPEQLNGEAPAPAQDVYSFAAMAYECLKGEPPFVRGAIEDQIKNKMPEALQGNDVQSVGIMAGLAKSPKDRPPSCMAVLGGSFFRIEESRRCSRSLMSKLNGWKVLKSYERLPLSAKCLAVAFLGIAAFTGLWVEKKINGAYAKTESIVTNVPPPLVVTRTQADEMKAAADYWMIELSSMSEGVDMVKDKCARQMDAAKLAYNRQDWGLACDLFGKVARMATDANLKSCARNRARTLKGQADSARELAEAVGALEYEKKLINDARRFAEAGGAAFGKEDFRTAVTMYNNAIAKYAEAEKKSKERLLQKAGAAMEKALSARHSAEKVFSDEFAGMEWDAATKGLDEAECLMASGDSVKAKEMFDKAANGFVQSAERSKDVQLGLLRDQTAKEKDKAVALMDSLVGIGAVKYATSIWTNVVAEYSFGTNAFEGASYSEAKARFGKVALLAEECEMAVSAAKKAERDAENEATAKMVLAAAEELKKRVEAVNGANLDPTQWNSSTSVLSSAHERFVLGEWESATDGFVMATNLLEGILLVLPKAIAVSESRMCALERQTEAAHVSSDGNTKEWRSGILHFTNGEKRLKDRSFDGAKSEYDAASASFVVAAKKGYAKCSSDAAFAAQKEVASAKKENERGFLSHTEKWNRAVDALKAANGEYKAGKYDEAKSSYEIGLALFKDILGAIKPQNADAHMSELPASRQVTSGRSVLGVALKTGAAKTLTLPGGAPMEMIYVTPGSFIMGGSPLSDNERENNEALHRVALTKGYWLGKYEVTQKQWQSVMGSNPSNWTGDNLPVENVSWNDCQEFIRKINSRLNCNARLPTEAEWEYACRAGTTGKCAGNGVLDDMGWYNDNSGSKTHPVGMKRANAWGFHDMHGNVWEWCGDWYGNYGGNATDPTGPASGSYRVLRGGCWLNFARDCRSANRFRFGPGYRSGIFGFRLCCSAVLNETNVVSVNALEVTNDKGNNDLDHSHTKSTDGKEVSVDNQNLLTTYTVQRGDYLAKISKKFGVTIASIKRLNNLSEDSLRIGQKLKLPGNIDVGNASCTFLRQNEISSNQDICSHCSALLSGGEMIRLCPKGHKISEMYFRYCTTCGSSLAGINPTKICPECKKPVNISKINH